MQTSLRTISYYKFETIGTASHFSKIRPSLQQPLGPNSQLCPINLCPVRNPAQTPSAGKLSLPPSRARLGLFGLSTGKSPWQVIGLLPALLAIL